MTQYAATKPSRAADQSAWLAALLTQCRGRPIPDEFRAVVANRLATLAFVDLLTGLEVIRDEPDRRLAIQLYTAWIGACTDPAQPLFAVWFNLGTEFVRVRDTAGAIGAFRNALALRPDFQPAATNLGLQLEAQGHKADALEIWGRALQSDEARVTLLNHRGRVMEVAGRLADAERELAISLATNSAQPDVIQHWLHLRQKMCRWPVLLPPAGLTTDDLIMNCGPLAALALTDDVPTQTAIATAWLARKTSPAPRRLAPDRYAHDRVRVGYLSTDFCSHAMAYLIAELFERHDRTRFSVHGYCIGRDDGSEIRARMRAAFDHFTVLAGVDDEQAARMIVADEIDVLIDLNGLTGGARPQILRWRPAPVQATYLGFIGPVPLPELDYLFCDDFVIPPDIASAYRPLPLAIAGNYQANDNRRVIGEPTTRAEAGLPSHAFVFCCFANHFKISEAMFAAWMEILGRVEGSVLWMAADNEWSHANLRGEALRRGVDPDRLLFAPRIDPAAYIARLPLADLLLDTFPYNAGTVASDALRMGLPLLTLRGRAFAARMAARLLTAIGAEDGIVDTLADYVEAAVALGSDPDRHTAFRAQFTHAAWQAGIGDIAGFTADYEAALLRLVTERVA